MCNSTALRKATRRLSQLYDDVLAPAGLRSTQHSLMSQIERTGDLTVSELAEALVMDCSALTHTLKLMERDGLVARTRNPHDGRSRLVTLTKAGRDKLASSKRLWSHAQRRFEAAYGPEHARTLRHALAAIASESFADAFSDATRRARPSPGLGHQTSATFRAGGATRPGSTSWPSQSSLRDSPMPLGDPTTACPCPRVLLALGARPVSRR
jgi:DNA-binding MarR family transcriptional regulator